MPIYVYTLPSEMSLQAMYENDPTRRGVFYANRVFLEMLHAKGRVTTDPDAAALFFVPVMLVQMGGNLWQPQAFLLQVVHYIQRWHPFWNRTGGADHIFITTQDKGGCWIPQELRPAIIISYFGYTAPMGFFGHEDRLAAAQAGKLRYRFRWAKKRYNLSEAACFTPQKDIVIPVDFRVDTNKIPSFESTRRKPGLTCDEERGTLLFMSGSVRNVLPEYSQGVRQAFYRMHRRAPGVKYQVGKWSIASLANSTFCLAPSGWGYGWRTYLSLAVQCIPVIVQPFVQQAFEDLLPYDTFSLRISPTDLPKLPALLRAVPKTRVCAMRAAAARYFRAVLWQQPDGLAYNVLQLSLCRRALRVLAQHRPGTSLSLYVSLCANRTVEELLERRPTRGRRATRVHYGSHARV